MKTPWRNGSASDSRSEGCVFESRRGQIYRLFFVTKDSSFFIKNQYETFASMYVDINCLHFKTALAIGRPGFEGFSTT